MVAIWSITLVGYLISTCFASPIGSIYHLRGMYADPLLESRQDQPLTAPVTFQTVTSTQTAAGLITQTCNVTLTPITGEDGAPAIRQEKQCDFDIVNGGQSSPPPNGNGDGNSSSETLSPTESTTSFQETQTTSIETTSTQESETSSAQETETATSSSDNATETIAPPVSEIGTGSIPISGTLTASGTESTADPSATDAATATESGPLAVSVIGTAQVTDTGFPSIPEPSSEPSSDSATITEPVTVITTLSDGQVSTAISTPSAAAAQEETPSTPGRKLEVLPIGLGVFAGVSVIALIVVGLVTYERTKYRKLFRQRKLAESGANMGYGGMAERSR